MRLADLLADSVTEPAPGLESVSVAGLSADSRQIARGFAFFAMPGAKADGLAYVEDALRRGASAIVAERRPTIDMPGALFIHVADVHRALALAAARFYRRQPETIVAVTGTSGKTSVAVFTRQIWEALGYRAASLGTIGLVSPSRMAGGSLTTPDPVNLHETLDALAGDGVTHLALEASSHGLDQRRLDGLRLKAAAFTNLSRDHLDYHLDLESYFAAKMRLFEVLLPRGAPALIDADSSVADKVEAICRKLGLDVFTVGKKGSGLRLLEQALHGDSCDLTLDYAGRKVSVHLPLAGAFQVRNALVAAGLVLKTGGYPDAIFAALEKLEGVSGRLELIGHRQDAPVFVDYAHKPDALENVLNALRPLTKGKLIVVFGCGGDRDKGKRPIMGEVAGRLADVVIVTDDNPRSEDADAIRREILAGISALPASSVLEIGDRRVAISRAVSMLAPGDVLLVAGKGHETGQIVGDKVIPFSDQQSVRAALRGFAA
ncbi:MAG TPA: UDP-N-acetylmuramoyl-L-alanyl-D-glutamate--2,6-diaminopimelate ligase [Methylovirgula sp.]|jgi:UDP-N-acetylmuramoyl-L-alanyl-D-glutamate--2,6-diaminopimelate ligase